MGRLFKVKVESPLFERTDEVVADSARGAAYAIGYDLADLSVARGTVETVDRAVFKSPFTPRITVEAVDTLGTRRDRYTRSREITGGRRWFVWDVVGQKRVAHFEDGDEAMAEVRRLNERGQ